MDDSNCIVIYQSLWYPRAKHRLRCIVWGCDPPQNTLYIVYSFMCDLLLIINKTQYILTLNFALQRRKISVTGRDLYWWYWDFKSDHMCNFYVLSKYHNRHMQQPNFLRRNLLIQHLMNQKKYNPTLNNLFKYIRSNINSYHTWLSVSMGQPLALLG